MPGFFGIIVAVVVIAIVVVFLNRFYRKSTRDVAIIRTGFGGQKTMISGGFLALPFLHKVDEVSMRTIRVEVRRAGEKSLITEDRMRVDAELEFYVRVQPSVEGVATAAQALGSKAFTPDGIRNMLEGRFIDAVQSVAASEKMDTLHEKRAEFVAKVAGLLRDNLAHNGILLDSVSLTRLDQAAFASLDENNAFNAVGMRRLAEIIAVNKKKRAEVEADADISVRQTLLDATKRRLLLGQEEEQAQISQRLEIEKIKASSDAETIRAREEAMVASENARIGREQETRSREIGKQRELRRLEIEAQLSSEIRKVDSSIALSGKQVEEAHAQAAAETARTQVVLAQEKVQTERERAVADRSREMAMKRVMEAGEVAEANADTEATVLLRRAKAEADATCARADAEKSRMLAESEGSRALISSEKLAQRFADEDEAREVPARPHPRDRLADDEAGRKDRQHPHPPGQRLRCQQREQWRGWRRRRGRQRWWQGTGHAGDGQHPRHGVAAAGAEEHRRTDRRGFFVGRRCDERAQAASRAQIGERPAPLNTP